MSEQNARDPYVGINEYIRDRARGQIPAYYTIGKVLSLSPMLIRAAGMNLDKEDLKIAQHLLPGWTELLTALEWPLTADLPKTWFYGECECGLSRGTAYVVRPEETVEGKTAAEAKVTHAQPLAVGDEVLLIPSSDGQAYYLVEKLVEVVL